MCKGCEAEFMDGKNAFCKCPGSWSASGRAMNGRSGSCPSCLAGMRCVAGTPWKVPRSRTPQCRSYCMVSYIRYGGMGGCPPEEQDDACLSPAGGCDGSGGCRSAYVGGQTLCHAFDKAVSASFPGGPDALLSAAVRHLPVLAFRTVWQRASAVWDMAAVFALHCSGDASAIR